MVSAKDFKDAIEADAVSINNCVILELMDELLFLCSVFELMQG